VADRSSPAGAPLTLVPEGSTVRVAGLDRPESPATAHLVALGVLPGAELTLVQRYPAFVVRMGNAEFALDRELAGRIQVREP
jgi:Fe2+ transport system protein FeoA